MTQDSCEAHYYSANIASDLIYFIGRLKSPRRLSTATTAWSVFYLSLHFLHQFLSPFFLPSLNYISVFLQVSKVYTSSPTLKKMFCWFNQNFKYHSQSVSLFFVPAKKMSISRIYSNNILAVSCRNIQILLLVIMKKCDWS